MEKELSRTSALASRHTTLGSGLEDWNGMGTAWTYHTDPDIEHNAIRENAGLFDMSGLKKVHIRGKDAFQVVHHVISRNMEKIDVGQSAYGSILNDEGKVCDDAIIYNNGNNDWLFVHGSGESMERLQESAKNKEVKIEFDDDLHDISLQGPNALHILKKHVDFDLTTLKYFHHQNTKLFGHDCILSRTGYSGERGYEIFASAQSIVDIWDKIIENGAMACSFTSLDKVRVEAALLFYGYDMHTEHYPWEVGLGWTISKKKDEYRGKTAALKAEGKERFKLVGIDVQFDDALAGGEEIIYNNETVGVINSPVWSERMKKSLALAHIRPDLTNENTQIKIKGDAINYDAIVSKIPFYDPNKLKTHV